MDATRGKTNRRTRRLGYLHKTRSANHKSVQVPSFRDFSALPAEITVHILRFVLLKDQNIELLHEHADRGPPALLLVNREIWRLMREIYYGENRITTQGFNLMCPLEKAPVYTPAPTSRDGSGNSTYTYNRG
jgi:hypothetical protein